MHPTGIRCRSRNWSRRPELLRPKVADIAKWICVSKASNLQLESRACLRVLEAFGFLMLKYMSHFSYVCKMRYPLNLVLESWEYLWSYLTFWIVIADGD